MKKVIILFVLILCGCSVIAKENYLPVNDVLTLSVRVKDDMEYIPVDQWSTPEDVDFLPYLDIETNKDDVEISYKWVGKNFSYGYEIYDKVLNSENIQEYRKKLEMYSSSNEEILEWDRKTTLNECGFDGISIFVTAKKDNLIAEQKIDTLLFIIPRENGDGFRNKIFNEHLRINGDIDDYLDSLIGLPIDEIQRKIASIYYENIYRDLPGQINISYFEQYGFYPNDLF